MYKDERKINICWPNIAQQPKWLFMETSTKSKQNMVGDHQNVQHQSITGREELLPLVSVFSYSCVAYCWRPWWPTSSSSHALHKLCISFETLSCNVLGLHTLWCCRLDLFNAHWRLFLVVAALLHVALFLRMGTWILCHMVIFLYSHQIAQCFTTLVKPLLLSLPNG